MKTLIVIGLVLAAASAARADFYTGNDLYARCKDNRLIAAGYIMGFSDGSKLTEIFDDHAVLKICMPTGVQNFQLVDMVCKHLEERPAQRHTSASWFVQTVLQDAYACPTEKKR